MIIGFKKLIILWKKVHSIDIEWQEAGKCLE